jgi:hypothetical protein
MNSSSGSTPRMDRDSGGRESRPVLELPLVFCWLESRASCLGLLCGGGDAVLDIVMVERDKFVANHTVRNSVSR